MKHKVKMGAAAVAIAALALTGCGSGGNGAGGPASDAARDSGSDIQSLISDNAQERDAIKDGGELRLSMGNIGPDFNLASQNGSNADNGDLQRVYNIPLATGCWNAAYDGTAELNKDFCESFESTIANGVQTIRIKINDKATFNDGTPIDAAAFINTWKMLNGSNPDVQIVTPGSWENVETVEQGDTPKDVVVTMKQITYPIDSLYGTILHPKVNSAQVFNEGFNMDPKSDWGAGPFKVEKFDSAALTITLVPNEKWWGEKPKLDRVTFRQMEPNAEIAAFKNGEIDAIQTLTLNRYNQVQGTADAEVRRGQRLFSGGMNMNAQAENLKDVNVRKAILAAVDRKALADIRYQGLNWTEEVPGSQMLMPFSPYYQDNYPFKETGPEVAKKVLTDAGYTENSKGIMEKDGKPAKLNITNFGDDPTTLAVVQTLQKQLQDAGMDVGIDQKGSADFGKVVGDRSFDMTISGYTMGSDATNAVKQYYDSQTSVNKVGSPELDARIAKVSTIEDNAERNKEAMDIEKAHMAEFADRGIAFNGPEIWWVKKGLANYGAELFKQYYRDWENIGWQK